MLSESVQGLGLSLPSRNDKNIKKKEKLLKSLDQLEDLWLLQEPIILTYQDQDVSLS